MSEAEPPKRSEEPHCEMIFERIFCPIHGEPFHARWPAGYITFAVRGIDLLLNDDPIFGAHLEEQHRAGFDGKQAMERLFDAVPLCCRLTDSSRLELYLKAGEATEPKLFPFARCLLCHKKGNGSKYRYTRNGTRQHVDHVCLRCVSYRIKPG